MNHTIQSLALKTLPVLAGVIGFQSSANAFTITVNQITPNSWNLISPPINIPITSGMLNISKTAVPKGNLGPFDMDITVNFAGVPPNPDGTPRTVMIPVNEDVLNLTGLHWDDYHIELGTGGFGKPFVRSGEDDQLFFKDDPAPKNTDHFKNPPMKDDLVDPDALWWFGGKGVDSGQITNFMYTINVFDNGNDGLEQFTLRQRASVPEPSTVLGLLALGTLGAASTLKRKLNSSKSNEKETTKVG